MVLNKDKEDNLNNQVAWININRFGQKLDDFDPSGKHKLNEYSFIEITRHKLEVPKEVHKASEGKYFASNETERKTFWLLIWGGTQTGYSTIKGIGAKSKWFSSLQDILDCMKGSLESGELI